MGDWREGFAAEWRERSQKRNAAPSKRFALAAEPFDEEEILAMAEVLLTGQLTLGRHVAEAEQQFAALVGMPYAVMVNSGSSANLLAVSAAVNKLRAVHCNPGDKVLVPAVAWSTSVFPIIQCGLTPVFVDVDPQTFNIQLEDAERKMTPDVKAMVMVHVLGNSCHMEGLRSFVEKHKLILVEDTCEALGSFYRDERRGEQRMLGTMGDFGTYSFYFSHHITSGEGGMVVCHTLEDYNHLRCLRAHGWTRHLTNRQEAEAPFQDIDARFLFVNVGYNLRPLEVQAAMLKIQMRKMAEFNECRRENLRRIHAAFARHPKFAQTMQLMQAGEGVDPAWFGIGLMLHRPYAHQLKALLAYLEAHGIENRPVISGNFMRQPAIRVYCPDERAEDYQGAEAVHHRAFFIGIHQIPIKEEDLQFLVDTIFGFEYVKQDVVLVLGSGGMLGRHVQQCVMEQNAGVALVREFGEDTLTAGDKKWVFATRSSADLTVSAEVVQLFRRHAPTMVLNCAARLQAIQKMSAEPVDFFLQNVTLNNNVLRVAHDEQRWIGPIKVVSVLSTVMVPANAQYPISNDALDTGAPHPACESYAYAKRMLAKLSEWYQTQHKDNFVCLLPGNIFGAFGDFVPATAPLVNALVARAVEAEAAGKSDGLKVLGTGKPLRQVIWAKDLARAAIWAMDGLNAPENPAVAGVRRPLIVAGEELSVREIAESVRDVVGFKAPLLFDENGVDGPLKRTADSSELFSLVPDFKLTPFKTAVESVVHWYRSK